MNEDGIRTRLNLVIVLLLVVIAILLGPSLPTLVLAGFAVVCVVGFGGLVWALAQSY